MTRDEKLHEKKTKSYQKMVEKAHSSTALKIKAEHLIYPELKKAWYNLTHGKDAQYQPKEVALAIDIMCLLEECESFEDVLSSSKNYLTRKLYEKAMELVTRFSKYGTAYHRFYYKENSQNEILEEYDRKNEQCSNAREQRDNEIQKYKTKQHLTENHSHSVGSSNYTR